MLGESLAEVITSLRPVIRAAGHDFMLHVDEEIRLDTWPGKISQVVTNFVANALVHAFPG